MFNKGQLAGLMKQAQAMQDNLKKAQDELANIEVEGESAPASSRSSDDLQARRQAHHHRPQPAGRRQGHARRPRGRRLQRRGAQGRGNQREKMGKLTQACPACRPA
jgi:hypothetical protein